MYKLCEHQYLIFYYNIHVCMRLINSILYTSNFWFLPIPQKKKMIEEINDLVINLCTSILNGSKIFYNIFIFKLA